MSKKEIAMTLTDEEKIQKAEEIYYRRNGISYRGEKKKKPFYKKYVYSSAGGCSCFGI